MRLRVAAVHQCDGAEDLQRLLSAVQAFDEAFLRRHPLTPALYASGVRYRPEAEACAVGADLLACGEERFLSVPEVIAQGAGDCDDLAPWRAAELRVRHGVEAHAVVFCARRHGSARLWHCVVSLPDGRTEDPSAVLGMGQVRS